MFSFTTQSKREKRGESLHPPHPLTLMPAARDLSELQCKLELRAARTLESTGLFLV